MGTILFVCVENTFRSVLAEEIFNSRAPRGWRAQSAGVSPASSVNPSVRQLLREVGIEMTERTPRVVTPELVARASRVVTFGCLDRCPIGAEKKGEDWPLPGSTGRSMDQLRETRDELARRVDDLILRFCVPKENIRPSTTERMRRDLLKAAQHAHKLTYGELMKKHRLSRGRALSRAIGEIDRIEYACGAPGFAAIIVRKDTGFPGGGYFCGEDLPQGLSRGRRRSTDPRLSALERKHVLEQQKKIWAFYRRGRSA